MAAQAGKVAQQAKLASGNACLAQLVTKHNDPKFNLCDHVVERENRL